MSNERDLADQIARDHLAKGDPLGWFNQLYSTARRDFGVIPWADRRPNPHLVDWCVRELRPQAQSRALVIGCGLGDDAEYIASKGARVTAFDLAPEAIHWARERFPESPVEYRIANLLSLPSAWDGAFDLVAECYTLQAMPQELRAAAVAAVGKLVAPGGDLVVVCRGRDESDPPGELPWPLTRADLEAIPLPMHRFEDFDDPYEPGKRRFRAHWRRV